MSRVKGFYKKYRLYIDYSFWGVSASLLSWLSYLGFYKLSFHAIDDFTVVLGNAQLPISVLIANILSWVFTIAYAFITNKLFVFRSKSFKKKILIPELVKFVSARLVTGFIEMIAVPVAVLLGFDKPIFGIEGILPKIVTSISVIILNYSFSRKIVFKKDKDASLN